ncbi:hypothetical protein [uncultured Clostridium sp.]|uniref:hypothetical protein n=1 Tax=uncultured Clostridium sp. TaxID=59620 RepID=UPI002622CAD1|nr:hypothetical protein [uncultured Clostridium sp.]
MKLINDFTLQDERLNKEDAILTAKGYIYTQIFALILFILELIFKTNVILIFQTAFILIICNLYIVIKARTAGLNILNILNPKDECLISFRNTFFKKAFYLILRYDLLIGVLALYSLYFTKSFNGFNLLFSTLNLLAIIIPCCYISIKQYKKGILGRTTTQTNSKKMSLEKRTFFATLVFGATMTSFQFISGNHTPLLLLRFFLINSISWGIMFYVFTSLLLKFAKKRNTKLENINEE